MPIDERWERLKPSDWRDFARAWLDELRNPPKSDECRIGQAVTWMNFTAPPAQQWQFIQSVMAQASSDEELGHIAAGPLEHLLGWHGEEYIDEVERWAANDARFARTLSGVWKYLMKDAVWKRVQAIQARVADPLQKA